ncbi:MAG TPA: hypothetical protein VGZ49_05595 [Xanthobacteraceae bacterium]|jgi:hypothetical protein|nr:hypothetical protein [Xanthobacteraceae bacterium]
MSRIERHRVTVTIDRLVLRGFAPGERDGIAAGLESELRRHLADPTQAEPSMHSRSDAVLRAGTIRGPGDPRDVGAAAARKIAAGIRRP